MSRPIDVAIIGAQKAGTSSLLRYLAQHPRICSHARNEVTCFLDEDPNSHPDTVHRHFTHCALDAVLLLKSVGLLDCCTALDRLREHNARMRLIVVLRHPVERAYSAYWYARRMGWEDQHTFAAAVRADHARLSDEIARRNCRYLARGEYARQLRAVYGRFPPAQVRVFLFEEFRTQTLRVCQEVFRFAGVEPDFVPDLAKKHNVAARSRSVVLARAFTTPRLRPLRATLARLLPGDNAWRLRGLLRRLNEVPFTPPPIDPALRAELLTYFRPQNRELAVMLGRDLSGWDR